MGKGAACPMPWRMTDENDVSPRRNRQGLVDFPQQRFPYKAAVLAKSLWWPLWANAERGDALLLDLLLDTDASVLILTTSTLKKLSTETRNQGLTQLRGNNARSWSPGGRLQASLCPHVSQPPPQTSKSHSSAWLLSSWGKGLCPAL